ncbi:MAG: hypothetical protein O7G87_16130, partial [bacterium]|nr:hypothetical protein [bacterium]
MSNYRRFGTFCVAVFAAFAFLTIGLGPERLDPWVTGLLGLKGPDPVRLLEVPRAEEVASRVLDGIRESNIRETMAYLTGLGSRVPGYAGHEAAARFIESKFRELGLERVTTESFDITSPVDQGGTLTNLDTGETFPIHGIWPNLVKTSTLPRGGIRTQLIDGGDGTFRALNGRDVEKTAVLMEFNTWNNWLKAAMLGAEQVIFIEPDSTSFTQAEQKFLQVPNSVERFWIDQASGRRLQAQLKEKGTISVELKARMEWEKNPAKNILGWIPGTDPVLRDKIVVINAYYDAMSVVPALAPGAEMACGIVGLLELASYFHTFPPGHTVLFLASTGHHLGSRGISDFLNRHSRKEKHFKALMSDPIDIPLFIGLDLSSQTDEIGVWNGSEHFFYKRFFTPFGKSFVQFGKAIAKRIGLDPRTALIDGINPKGGVNWDMYMPGENLKVDGEWVLKAGTPALNLVTVNDARFRVDTPLDTPAFVNYKNLTGQIRLLAGVLDLSLNWEPFLPSYKLEPDDRMRALKGYVRTFPRRSITPNKPRPGAIAVLRTVSNGYPRTGSPKSVRGVRMIYYDLADEKGEFYIPGLIDFANRANPRVNLQTFYLDPESGEITYAPNRKTTNRAYSDTFVANWWTIERTLILFPCVATDFYDTVDPRYLNTLHQISVYGEGNTVPQEYGYSIGSGEDEPVGVVFTSPGEKVKVAMRSGSIGVRLLLLNSSSAETKQIARGAGFQIWSHGSFVRTSFQAAKDMWTLNEARMQELRDFSIENQRLEALHAQAKHHIDEAERAMQEKDWDSFAKHSRAGLGIESRAYPDVKATQNDVIRGVIFFMILVIPCAFFVERLVFTASDIRWQILGLTGVFIVIWMLISQVHPAFQLSNPFVILLSFVIMFLALFVIAIVFGRFNDNMRRLRSDDVLLHDTDVGRVSASVAAFHLGIANMKRRKLRTWLTFVTLVLLTFTVLSFTSIKSSLEFHQLHRDVEGVYPGFLIRSKFWGALEESAYDYASVNFKDVAIVVPRSWYVTKENKKTPVSVGKQSVKAPGVLGMVPEEAQVTGIDKFLTTGRWFRPGETACILPGKTADLLGVKPRDVGRKHVRLFGKQLKVIG